MVIAAFEAAVVEVDAGEGAAMVVDVLQDAGGVEGTRPLTDPKPKYLSSLHIT